MSEDKSLCPLIYQELSPNYKSKPEKEAGGASIEAFEAKLGFDVFENREYGLFLDGCLNFNFNEIEGLPNDYLCPSCEKTATKVL